MATGVLHTLSLEEVEAALTEGRSRGQYLEDVKKFFASGELAMDFSEKYPKKEASSLRTSVDNNVKKMEEHPEYKIVLAPNGDGETKHVLLINMETYHLQKQENEA